jgi:hypothetical protein
MWGWELGTSNTMYTNSGWVFEGNGGVGDRNVAETANTFQPAVGYGGGRFCFGGANAFVGRNGRIRSPATGPNALGTWQRFIFHDAIKRRGNTGSNSDLDVLSFYSGNTKILTLRHTTTAALTSAVSLYEWNGAGLDLLATSTTTYSSADLYHRFVCYIDGLGSTTAVTGEDITNTPPDGLQTLWSTSSGNLINVPANLPIVPGSVTVNWTSSSSSYSQTDDGAGGFTGDGNPPASSINYTTGAMTIDMASLPPDTSTSITIDYTKQATGRYKIYIDGVLEIDTEGNTGFTSIDNVQYWGTCGGALSATNGMFHDHSVLWDAGNHATQELDMSTQPADTNTVTINGKTYTFQAVLTNVDGNVYRGASAAEAQRNLMFAINLGPGAGTLYANATTLNPDVYAEPDAQIGTGGGLQIIAKLVGTTPNSYVLSDTLPEGWPTTPTTLGAVSPGDLDETNDLALALGDIFIQSLQPNADATTGSWDTQPTPGQPLWSNVNDGSDLTNFIETATSPDLHTLDHEDRTDIYSVNATGTMTVSGTVQAGDQVELNGTTITAAGTTSATQFDQNAGSDELVAQSIISAFTAAGEIPTTVTSATNGSGVITYTAVTPGTPGNSITISVPTNVGGALSVSGPTLTGGNEWQPSEVHAIQTLQIARGSGAISSGRTITEVPTLGTVVSDEFALAAAGQMVNTVREWRDADTTTDVDGVETGFRV